MQWDATGNHSGNDSPLVFHALNTSISGWISVLNIKIIEFLIENDTKKRLIYNCVFEAVFFANY